MNTYALALKHLTLSWLVGEAIQRIGQIVSEFISSVINSCLLLNGSLKEKHAFLGWQVSILCINKAPLYEEKASSR